MTSEVAPDVATQVAVELLRTMWTCKKTNTIAWMRYLVERMNEASHNLGRPQRWEYRNGDIVIIPGTNPPESEKP